MQQKFINKLIWILTIIVVSSCRREIILPDKPVIVSDKTTEVSRSGGWGNLKNDMVMYWNEKTMQINPK